MNKSHTCPFCGLETEPDLRYHEKGDCGFAVLQRFNFDSNAAITYLVNEVAFLTRRVMDLESIIHKFRD